ncbi:MAG: carboxypeptidase-like regulatory domain-containing protein, partial [Bacteroidetes bacterium]|nr:carboxypeptidase-like regulatory domain-containing protein [Bacteroidota bacterium]
MTNLLSRCSVLLVLLLLAFTTESANAQNGTVSGTITVEEDGVALPGANVVALDASGGVKAGAASDVDGKYSLTLAAGSYTLRARFVGFQDCETEITVVAGGTITFDCAMSQTGLELNTVVVAASRRQEKALDAPASISVLSGEEVANTVGGSSVEALRTTPGVGMQQ